MGSPMAAAVSGANSAFLASSTIGSSQLSRCVFPSSKHLIVSSSRKRSHWMLPYLKYRHRTGAFERARFRLLRQWIDFPVCRVDTTAVCMSTNNNFHSSFLSTQVDVKSLSFTYYGRLSQTPRRKQELTVRSHHLN